jgi:hypothetical protein
LSARDVEGRGSRSVHIHSEILNCGRGGAGEGVGCHELEMRRKWIVSHLSKAEETATGKEQEESALLLIEG